MGKIPTESELRFMYQDEKLSLSEIGSFTSSKVHKILYWMDKYGIPRRNRTEANYLKHNPCGEPFEIKKKLTREEVKLKYLALGLYWGEGGKTVRHSVKIVNSDPGVIQIFVRYLIKICNVRLDKIHYYLQTFKDNDILEAKRFWAKELMISHDIIHTCSPVRSLGKGTYQNISKYGVMSAEVGNVHLKSYIMKEIAKLSIK